MMAKFKRVGKKNLRNAVLELVAMCEAEMVPAKEVYAAINELLDDFRDRDIFGTEGQLDPRGDPRS